MNGLPCRESELSTVTAGLGVESAAKSTGATNDALSM